LALTRQPRVQAQPLPEYVATHPGAVWLVGPLFAAVTGVAFKEGMCAPPPAKLPRHICGELPLRPCNLPWASPGSGWHVCAPPQLSHAHVYGGRVSLWR